MDNLSLIAAIGYNSELGIDNHLIWHIREDMKFYRSMTMGKNIIMGRKTLESLPPKALERRNAFVLSSRPVDSFADVSCFKEISHLLDYVQSTPEEFMVIGGASIYTELLPYVDTMYLTEILEEYPTADTYFPYFDIKDWDKENIRPLVEEEAPYEINKYMRKKVR